MNFKNMSKHTDNKGNVRMIDISDKDITKRVAKAEGYIELSKEALDSIVNNVLVVYLKLSQIVILE